MRYVQFCLQFRIPSNFHHPNNLTKVNYLRHKLFSTLRYSSGIKSILLETKVTGPLTSLSLRRVKWRTKHWSNTDLPTFEGPTIATTIGGGSTGVRSTKGMCVFFSLMFAALKNIKFDNLRKGKGLIKSLIKS